MGLFQQAAIGLARCTAVMGARPTALVGHADFERISTTLTTYFLFQITSTTILPRSRMLIGS